MGDLEALPQEVVVPQEAGSDMNLRLQLLSLPGGWRALEQSRCRCRWCWAKA